MLIILDIIRNFGRTPKGKNSGIYIIVKMWDYDKNIVLRKNIKIYDILMRLFSFLINLKNRQDTY